jgi:hypothetical protein
MATHRNAYRVIYALLLLVASIAGSAAVLADDRVATAPLIAHDDPVALPGVGKILFAFAVTVAVGIAFVYVLRKLLPKLSGQFGKTVGMQARTQIAVHPGLRLHVVDVQGRTVLLAEGKTGIAMTVLPAAEDKLKQNEP